MNFFDRIDASYKKPDVKYTPNMDGKDVFVGDCHMGGGDKADDFAPNAPLFRSAFLPYYREKKFNIWYPGDRFELYQFSKKEVKKTYPDLFDNDKSLEGNHDMSMGFPKSLLINSQLGPILVIHGHQSELWNDQWNWLGRLFTLYVWKPLEYLGIKDPPPSTGRHSAQRDKLIEWANTRKVTLIHDHIHLLEHNGYEWDCGYCGIPGKLQCIELEGTKLTMVEWNIKDLRKEIY